MLHKSPGDNWGKTTLLFRSLCLVEPHVGKRIQTHTHKKIPWYPFFFFLGAGISDFLSQSSTGNIQEED